jgi:hypothetical protein
VATVLVVAVALVDDGVASFVCGEMADTDGVAGGGGPVPGSDDLVMMKMKVRTAVTTASAPATPSQGAESTRGRLVWAGALLSAFPRPAVRLAPKGEVPWAVTSAAGCPWCEPAGSGDGAADRSGVSHIVGGFTRMLTGLCVGV